MVWLALRLVKFLALAAFASGVGLASAAPRQSTRAQAAFWLATPALIGVWLAGYGLLKTTSRSLSDPFVTIALVAGLASLHGALLSASKPAPSVLARGLGPVGLAVATAAMVTRDSTGALTAAASLTSVGLTAALVALLPPTDGADDPAFPDAARRWFVALARLEGLSLVGMLFVAMPFRAMTGHALDGGTGAIGWLHGTLLLVFVTALPVMKQALGWSWGTTALAFASSLFPFGTFVFEWRLLPRRAPTVVETPRA